MKRKKHITERKSARELMKIELVRKRVRIEKKFEKRKGKEKMRKMKVKYEKKGYDLKKGNMIS